MRVRQVKAGVFLGQFWGKIFQIGAILGQKYRGNEVLWGGGYSSRKAAISTDARVCAGLAAVWSSPVDYHAGVDKLLHGLVLAFKRDSSR